MCNYCPACESSEQTILGVLGTREHFRCRRCGWEWSQTVEPEADTDEPEESDGQPDEMQEWHDFDPDC